jgi:hypothetical protein
MRVVLALDRTPDGVLTGTVRNGVVTVPFHGVMALVAAIERMLDPDDALRETTSSTTVADASPPLDRPSRTDR